MSVFFLHSLHLSWHSLWTPKKEFHCTGKLVFLTVHMTINALNHESLNQNSLSEAWQSLQFKISQNRSISDPMMNSFSTAVPPTVTELRKQFGPMSRWYAHAWTKNWNHGVKCNSLWFLIVYVKGELINGKWTSELNQFIETNCLKESVHRKESDFLICLRLWITCKNAVNNVQFLAETNHFAS